MSCPNYTGEALMLSRGEQYLAIILYSVITFLAVVGNATVVFIVYKFRRLRTATNYFIVNLALADILMASVCIPFSYWHVLVLQYWPFGALMCPLIHFCQTIAVMLNAHTLIVISIDRFLAIQFPLRHQLTERGAVWVLCCVWAVDILISMPIAVVQRTVLRPNSTAMYDCVEDWSLFQHDDGEIPSWLNGAFIYSQANMILQYFLPLLIILLSYLGIGLRLWYAKAPGESAKGTDRGRRRDSMKKLLWTMCLVSFMYTLSWLPLNTFIIMWTRCESYLNHPYVLYIWWGCHFTAMSHTAVNPLIYLATSARYREGFAYVFNACFPCCISYKPLHLTYTPVYATGMVPREGCSEVPSSFYKGHQAMVGTKIPRTASDYV